MKLNTIVLNVICSICEEVVCCCDASVIRCPSQIFPESKSESLYLQWHQCVQTNKRALSTATAAYFLTIINNNKHNSRFLFDTVAKLTLKQPSLSCWKNPVCLLQCLTMSLTISPYSDVIDLAYYRHQSDQETISFDNCLCNIAEIQSFLYMADAKILIHTFVSSRLDYCKVLALQPVKADVFWGAFCLYLMGWWRKTERESRGVTCRGPARSSFKPGSHFPESHVTHTLTIRL